VTKHIEYCRPMCLSVETENSVNYFVIMQQKSTVDWI